MTQTGALPGQLVSLGTGWGQEGSALCHLVRWARGQPAGVPAEGGGSTPSSRAEKGCAEPGPAPVPPRPAPCPLPLPSLGLTTVAPVARPAQEFENAEGEECPAAATQNGPDVYVLPLTEVSLPMARQPGRSGEPCGSGRGSQCCGGLVGWGAAARPPLC